MILHVPAPPAIIAFVEEEPIVEEPVEEPAEPTSLEETEGEGVTSQSVSSDEEESFLNQQIITNNTIIYFLLIESIEHQNLAADTPEAKARVPYEEAISALQTGMKKHAKVPTYEDSVKLFDSKFATHHISVQEIGSTLFRRYAYYGPRPRRQL